MTALRRVMIVEDDTAIAEMLWRALRPKYQVTVAGNGDEALRVAAKVKPDLVLLDITLPGLDGFAVAHALKHTDELRRTIIIFLTARDGSMDVVRGINAGARHYITKPFRLDDVLGKVRRLLPS